MITGTSPFNFLQGIGAELLEAANDPPRFDDARWSSPDESAAAAAPDAAAGRAGDRYAFLVNTPQSLSDGSRSSTRVKGASGVWAVLGNIAMDPALGLVPGGGGLKWFIGAATFALAVDLGGRALVHPLDAEVPADEDDKPAEQPAATPDTAGSGPKGCEPNPRSKEAKRARRLAVEEATATLDHASRYPSERLMNEIARKAVMDVARRFSDTPADVKAWVERFKQAYNEVVARSGVGQPISDAEFNQLLNPDGPASLC